MKTITKEMVDSLSSDDITKKEYDRISDLISDRVDEIWRFICKTFKKKLYWWAFRNDVELGRGDGSTGGEFDPSADKKFIEIIGEASCSQNPFCPFEEGFPTEYLWNDYKELVMKEFEVAKEKYGEKKKKHSGKKALKTKPLTETIKGNSNQWKSNMTDWTEAGKKAWETRRANQKKARLSEIANKAVATRKSNQQKRSEAAKKAWQTRKAK